LLDKQLDHYSIEGIASMCGFSTISTFNTNFKRITGVTPSYYRENRDLIK
jgi:AraC-like DNA-binding protein